MTKFDYFIKEVKHRHNIDICMALTPKDGGIDMTILIPNRGKIIYELRDRVQSMCIFKIYDSITTSIYSYSLRYFREEINRYLNGKQSIFQWY